MELSRFQDKKKTVWISKTYPWADGWFAGGMTSNGEVTADVAVSYTHLDVYKRQVKHKKNPALCYRAGFFELLFPTIRIQHCAEYVGKVSHHEYWSYR